MQPYKAQDGTAQPFIHNPSFSVIGFRHPRNSDRIDIGNDVSTQSIPLQHPIAIFSRNRPGKAKRTPKRLRRKYKTTHVSNQNAILNLVSRRYTQYARFQDFHTNRQYQERADARKRREGVLA